MSAGGQQQLNGEARRRRCNSTDVSCIPNPQEEQTEEQELQKELDGVYNLFFVNNNWYFFLRLHQTLCTRLLRVYRQAERQLLEHRADQSAERLLVAEGRRDKATDLAMELRLKQPSKNTHTLINSYRKQILFEVQNIVASRLHQFFLHLFI